MPWPPPAAPSLRHFSEAQARALWNICREASGKLSTIPLIHWFYLNFAVADELLQCAPRGRRNSRRFATAATREMLRSALQYHLSKALRYQIGMLPVNPIPAQAFQLRIQMPPVCPTVNPAPALRLRNSYGRRSHCTQYDTMVSQFRIHLYSDEVCDIGEHQNLVDLLGGWAHSRAAQTRA